MYDGRDEERTFHVRVHLVEVCHVGSRGSGGSDRMGVEDAMQLKAMVVPLVVDDGVQELRVDGVGGTGGARPAVEHEVRDVGDRGPEVRWSAEESSAAFSGTASDSLPDLVEGTGRECDFHDVERIAARDANRHTLGAAFEMLFHDSTDKFVDDVFYC